MQKNMLKAGLLALALAAGGASAQTAAAANPVDAGTIQALKAMGAHLQSLQRFRLKIDLSAERVLADGQKLQQATRATLDVAQPDRVRVETNGARSSWRLYYDGKSVSLFMPAQKYYATLPFSGTLDELAQQLSSRYVLEIPLQDLFAWGTPYAQLDKIEAAMHAGQAVIGNDLCEHYAFRQGQLDWQVWITTGSRPLPRKLVITNRSDEARPQSVSLLEWNLKPDFGDAVFRFTPPAGARTLEMVPQKSRSN